MLNASYWPGGGALRRTTALPRRERENLPGQSRGARGREPAPCPARTFLLHTSTVAIATVPINETFEYADVGSVAGDLAVDVPIVSDTTMICATPGETPRG
jgi:hypothetical protein